MIACVLAAPSKPAVSAQRRCAGVSFARSLGRRARSDARMGMALRKDFLSVMTVMLAVSGMRENRHSTGRATSEPPAQSRRREPVRRQLHTVHRLVERDLHERIELHVAR